MPEALPAASAGSRWALVNGFILDGDPHGYAGPGGLLLDEGRIVAAGSSVTTSSAANTPQLDLQGRSVLPGMIDCHVHLAWSAGPTPVETLIKELRDPTSLALRVAANAVSTLHRGVTTVRDLGGPSETLFALRSAVADGRLMGPRILASGHVITRRSGHCHFVGRWARGPEEVRRAAARQAAAGADAIKIMVTGGVHTPGTSPMDVQYDRATISAAVETAHVAGIPATCHATNRLGLARALAAGVDSVQHGGPLTKGQARIMAAQRVRLTPTLSTRHALEVFGADPRIPRAIAEKAMLAGPRRWQGLRDAIGAGVTIAAGTDAGTTYVPHGSMATEVRLLSTVGGMSPRAAIATATWNAAQEVGMSGRLGTLSSGSLADLIVVDGDPVADLSTLERIMLVIRDGIPAGGPWLSRAISAAPITFDDRGG